MIALAEQCMADYDEKGWTGDTWLNPDDVAYPGCTRAGEGGGVMQCGFVMPGLDPGIHPQRS